VGEDGHQVYVFRQEIVGKVGRGLSLTVEDTSDFTEESSNPLGSLGDLDVEELFNGKGVAEFVCH
jgi:hypothetical protein